MGRQVRRNISHTNPPEILCLRPGVPSQTKKRYTECMTGDVPLPILPYTALAWLMFTGEGGREVVKGKTHTAVGRTGGRFLHILIAGCVFRPRAQPALLYVGGVPRLEMRGLDVVSSSYAG